MPNCNRFVHTIVWMLENGSNLLLCVFAFPWGLRMRGTDFFVITALVAALLVQSSLMWANPHVESIPYSLSVSEAVAVELSKKGLFAGDVARMRFMSGTTLLEKMGFLNPSEIDGGSPAHAGMDWTGKCGVYVDPEFPVEEYGRLFGIKTPFHTMTYVTLHEMGHCVARLRWEWMRDFWGSSGLSDDVLASFEGKFKSEDSNWRTRWDEGFADAFALLTMPSVLDADVSMSIFSEMSKNRTYSSPKTHGTRVAVNCAIKHASRASRPLDSQAEIISAAQRCAILSVMSAQ